MYGGITVLPPSMHKMLPTFSLQIESSLERSSKFPHPGIDGIEGDAPDSQAIGDIVIYGHMREEGIVLEDIPVSRDSVGTQVRIAVSIKVSWPIRICPASGVINPATRLRIVDFPAPLSPRRTSVPLSGIRMIR